MREELPRFRGLGQILRARVGQDALLLLPKRRSIGRPHDVLRALLSTATYARSIEAGEQAGGGWTGGQATGRPPAAIKSCEGKGKRRSEV